MSLFTIPVATLKNYLNKGHSRSINTKKNIVASLFLKGGSMAISLLLLPLTVQYVNAAQYGIWLTLSSIIGWFSFFDVGLGQGLRNKFTEAVAKGEHELARIYVSTTYAILIVIIGIVLFIFFCINPFLNWANILNTSPDIADELRVLALIVFVFFCIQFVLQLLSTILIANQESAKASLLNFFASLASLIIIFFLTKFTSGNLIYLAAAFSCTPALVLAIASFWCFSGKYRLYTPSIKFVKFKFSKDLAGLGIKFFIIQIGVLALLQTDNIIISQLFGSKEVTVYNVAYKLFSVVIVLFSIIIAPFWSAFTEAFATSDMEWIRNSYFKIYKVYFGLILLTVVLLFLSPFLFRIWMGDKVNVSLNLSAAIALYVIANCWLMIPCFLLNGIGKIRLQLYLYVGCIFLNIPLCFVLGKLFYLPGVALSNFIILIAMSICLTIQARKIINNSATGIWAK